MIWNVLEGLRDLAVIVGFTAAALIWVPQFVWWMG